MTITSKINEIIDSDMHIHSTQGQRVIKVASDSAANLHSHYNQNDLLIGASAA